MATGHESTGRASSRTRSAPASGALLIAAQAFAALALAALSLTAGCGAEPHDPRDEPPGPDPGADWVWDLPAGIPAPHVPPDNPMSAASVELGRFLFHDPILSRNRDFSCASCHIQALAFTDGLPRAIGSTGEEHPRGSMSLTNVAYNATLNWANPHFVLLEQQASVPIFGDDPIELGLRSHEELTERLLADDAYVQRFVAAFGSELGASRADGNTRDERGGSAEPVAPEDVVTVRNVTRALAAFQRTMTSFDAPWDRYGRGDRGAISDAAKRGAELFFSERLECFHCHGGFNLSSSVDHDGLIAAEVSFHNNGLYNVDGAGAYPARNPGLAELTDDPADHGLFRAPTLRNIAVTAPYMHDGSLETLEDVIRHYARGGTLTADGPNAGDGALSPLRSPFVVGFIISDDEVADLIAFLEALTDESFLTREDLSSPFDDPPTAPR